MREPKAQGYVFALLAITIFSAQDGISKHLAEHYPPVFVTMLRFWAFGLFAAFAAKRAGGLAAAAHTSQPLLQLTRGVLLALQIVMAITCFAVVGLARTQAIFSATPLFVTMLSIPLLGEKVGWRRWTAIGIGLCGVLLILRPQGGFIEPKLLLAVLTALLFAVYVIITRLVSRHDAPMTSFFFTGILGAATMTLIGPFFWTPMAAGDWAWMAVLCTTSISGHYQLIRAYDLLDASAVQPLTYLSLVYSSLIGVSVFGESLTWNMIAGSAVVVAAGAFTIWREHVLSRRQSSR